MRRLRFNVFGIVLAFLLVTTSVASALAENPKDDQTITWVPVQPGTQGTVVASLKVELSKDKVKPKPGDPSPQYSLSSYGTGTTTLTRWTGGLCNGHEATGYGDTYVYDNGNYNPELIGSMYANSSLQESHSSENLTGDREAWTTNHHCTDNTATWSQNSTHKIWQTTLFTHVLVDNESYYVSATF